MIRGCLFYKVKLSDLSGMIFMFQWCHMLVYSIIIPGGPLDYVAVHTRDQENA